MRMPLSFYKEEEDSLQFYLLDCGNGLMHLLIFPDDTVMLFDCNITDGKEEEIVDFLGKHIPKKDGVQPIDIFVNSHRDTDHLRGLDAIDEKFPIQSIWDSGQTGANTGGEDYQFYMQLRRDLKKLSDNNLKVPVPSTRRIATFGGAAVYCLSSSAEFQEDEDILCEEFVKIQHTNCIVLLVCYAGRSILMTGDSDWKCWKEKIVPNFTGAGKNYLEDIDILIASHHGSRSFFTDESNDHIDEEENPETTYLDGIKILKPVITLISCGEKSVHHHPNEEAVKLYEEYGKHENGQVYTTNALGTLCGIINQSGHSLWCHTASGALQAHVPQKMGCVSCVVTAKLVHT